MSKLAIYARKSTESEDRQVLSIGSQVHELKAFAEKAGLKVQEVFTESKSAKAPGRLIFNQLFKKVQKGEIDSILCWKLDRLARNPVDGGSVIWAMEEQKLQCLHTPQRDFINNGNDKFWMQLEFGMAKKYVDDLSDNVKRGLRAKIEQGWQPGLAPLGYLNDKVNKTIVKDPERFTIIKRMWKMMLSEKHSAREILDVATDQWGLRTRKLRKIGGGPVAFSSVYTIFTNPFYYGAILFNNELHKGSQEPMIKKSEFDKVQELLGLKSKARPKHHNFAYTGLMKCGECGCGITAEFKINRYGYEYTYYHCTRSKRQHRCRQGFVEVRKLESQVSAFLESIAITKEVRDWCIQALIALEQDDKGKEEVTVKALQARLVSCDKEIQELLNCKLRGLITDEEFISKRKELQGDKFRVQELLDDRGGQTNKIIQEGSEFFDFAYKAKEKFENGSAEQKRAILKYTSSNLVLTDRELLIEAKRPLYTIQQNQKSLQAEIGTFEPREFSFIKHKNQLEYAGFCERLGVVEDVRTFLREVTTLSIRR